MGLMRAAPAYGLRLERLINPTHADTHTCMHISRVSLNPSLSLSLSLSHTHAHIHTCIFQP